MLQLDDRQLHQNVLLGEHTACCNQTVENFIRTFCWENTLLAATRQWRTSLERSARRIDCLLQWDVENFLMTFCWENTLLAATRQ